MSIKSNGDYNQTQDSFGYNSSFLEESFYGGNCVKCDRKAIGTCEVCGSFYCSAHCQHADWPQHKNVCGIPRLILNKSTSVKTSFNGKGNLSSSSSVNLSRFEPTPATKPQQTNGRQEIKKPEPILNKTIDGSSLVIITTVIDERTVYVRSISDTTEYIKANEDITEFSRRAVNLTVLPEKGDIILSKFNGIYYRALVTNIVNKYTVVVAYLEYGNVERKNLTDLKKLKPELQLIPTFINKVNLKDISIDVKSEKVLEFLLKNLNNSTNFQIIFNKENLKEVELINDLTKESLNKIIIDMVTIRPPAKFGNFSVFTVSFLF